MIRIFDFIFSLTGLLLLWPVALIVYILGMIDNGSPIFIQERVGRHKKPFKLIKFRTMPVNTESVATHLAKDVTITKLGSFLRKSKLDELPQLINVLKGDMSLVGPRPNLFNQTELMEERDKRGIYNVVPGVTGLAQIQEIDMSTPVKLAEKDSEMISSLTVSNYFKYIFATVRGQAQGDRIQT